jgi:hypothetical protein
MLSVDGELSIAVLVEDEGGVDEEAKEDNTGNQVLVESSPKNFS